MASLSYEGCVDQSRDMYTAVYYVWPIAQRQCHFCFDSAIFTIVVVGCHLPVLVILDSPEPAPDFSRTL